MAEDLLNCPFCGAPAELERITDHHGEWFNLGCSRHWGAVEDPDVRCPAGRIWYTSEPEEESAAIAAWNRRTPSSPTPADPGAGEREGDLTAVGRYYIHQDGLWLASFDTPEDRDQALAAMRALSGVKDPEGFVRLARDLRRAGQALKADLLDRAEWCDDAKEVCVGSTAWANFDEALAALGSEEG